jgi:hypothetical protein
MLKFDFVHAGGLRQLSHALSSFQQSLEVANALGDQDAANAIEKSIRDISSEIDKEAEDRRSTHSTHSHDEKIGKIKVDRRFHYDAL